MKPAPYIPAFAHWQFFMWLRAASGPMIEVGLGDFWHTAYLAYRHAEPEHAWIFPMLIIDARRIYLDTISQRKAA